VPLSDIYGTYFEGFETQSAFRFYEAVRHQLPEAEFPEKPQAVTGLLEIANQIDVFVFDAYGVLNVGGTPIDGAREVVAKLRQMGKKVFVLTNAATFPAHRSEAKFNNLGYDFAGHEIISSRMAAQHWVAAQDIKLWGVMGHKDSAPQDFAANTIMLGSEPELYTKVNGFLLLSTWHWDTRQQELLDNAITSNPRPIVIANPDVIAPLEERFSTEPGFIGHRILARYGSEVIFHGKPFPSVFKIVENRLPASQNRARIAMIGDTLHTDVLGGASRGWSTVLVKDHGLFRGFDVAPFITQSGIVPNYIVPTI